MKATVRAVALTLLAVVTSYVSGCRPSIETRTYAQGSVFTPVAQLAEFTENSVRVTLSLESDQQRHPILRATFAPTEAGLHLYGKDLPEAGIQGIGVPTRSMFRRSPRLHQPGRSSRMLRHTTSDSTL